MSRRATAIFGFLLLPAIVGADVTVRYKVDYKLNPSLPPAVSQALNTARFGSPGITILIKGKKSRAALANLTAINDLSSQTITLLDPVRLHFATIPASQFTDQTAGAMPKMPAAIGAMLSSLKITSDSRVTGRTAEIQGMHAEEHEFVLAVNMPAANDAQAAPVMKLVMQLWLPRPEEAARNPVLQEFVASGIQRMSGMNPADAIQKLFAQFPAMGDSLSAFMNEVSAAHSFTLRLHSEIFMPVLAMFSQSGNNALSGVDPNAALLSMDQEVVELSAAPVNDLVFQIPNVYTEVPVADILAANMPASAPPTVPAPAPSAGDSVGNGMTQPVLINKVDPAYTDEALAKKLEGEVTLSVTIDADGKPTNMQVIRSLDPGLDQKAIEAVARWRFRPGMKNGVPVAVRANVQVNFRIAANPHAQN